MGKSNMLSQLIEASRIPIHLISHAESTDWGRMYTIHPINEFLHAESLDWGRMYTI